VTANPVLIRDLVAANHILYDHGVVDAFGHVSVRRFLLARNMAPGSVTARDILEFHLDGSPVDPQGPRPGDLSARIYLRQPKKVQHLGSCFGFPSVGDLSGFPRSQGLQHACA
jgi:Class II Aldolase and Adducin N-terminal domain